MKRGVGWEAAASRRPPRPEGRRDQASAGALASQASPVTECDSVSARRRTAVSVTCDTELYSGRVAGDDVTIEVNGREADQAAVSLLEHEGWGHFTAMQVRAGRARGLDLHLSRL